MLIGVGVLLAAVWLWSCWHAPGARLGSVHVGVYRGLLAVNLEDSVRRPLNGQNVPLTEEIWAKGTDDAPGLELGDRPPRGFAYFASVHGAPVACMPLWPIWLVCLIAGTLLNRWDVRALRRADRSRCVACGYCLVGLGADARCPECGKA